MTQGKHYLLDTAGSCAYELTEVATACTKPASPRQIKSQQGERCFMHDATPIHGTTGNCQLLEEGETVSSGSIAPAMPL